MNRTAMLVVLRAASADFSMPTGLANAVAARQPATDEHNRHSTRCFAASIGHDPSGR
jgi:hypothetical protein